MSLNLIVETVINDKINNQEMFTAHDVTLEVRNRGHRAKHDEVRDLVHNFYVNGGFNSSYTRTNISVPNGNPFLYHNMNDDPSSYQKVRGTMTQNNNQTITIPSNIDSCTDQDVNLVTNRLVDARNTLSIPTCFVRDAGMGIDQKVYVYQGGRGAKVSSDKPNGGYFEYTVDSHNQIRITQYALASLGIGGKEYDVELVNDQLGKFITIGLSK